MSDQPSESRPGQGSKLRAFGSHVLTMPRWQKTLLTFAALLFGAGSVGQITSYFSPAPAATVTGRDDPGQTNLVDADRADTKPQAKKESQSTVEWLSPKATKVGLSFIVGFIVGWIFRAFIKTATLIVGGGIALLAAVSYFFNIDLSGIQKQSTSFLSWLTTQAENILDVVKSYLPSAMSSGAGLFVGFRRKR